MRNGGTGGEVELDNVAVVGELFANVNNDALANDDVSASIQTMRQMEIGFKTIKQIIAQDCNFLSPTPLTCSFEDKW